MQTTFPRLSKLIAASPPGKLSRRRQDASVCNGHISEVFDSKFNRVVSILRNSNKNDTGGKFSGKIPATCFTTTNEIIVSNKKS
jgi:hypothetical protein